MGRESDGLDAGGSARMGALPEDFFEGNDRPAGPLPRLKGPAAATPTTVVVRRPVLPVLGAVLLGAAVMYLSGLLSGWALARKETTAAGPAPAPPAKPDPRVGRLQESLGSKAERADLDEIRAELGVIAERIEGLGGRLDALPKPEPQPDLGPLRTRIETLAQETARLAAVPESVRKLEERIGALDEGLGTIRNDLGALGDRVKTIEARAAAAAVAAKPDPAKLAEQARERGLALYREGKFVEARAAFLNGAESNPKDARLWYFAALANGFATGDWGGETERLVRRGIDAEKGNATPRTEIDAALSGVPEEGGGRWLREWRQRAVGP
jgi:tetratricopeptide (TPR) repeat protein